MQLLPFWHILAIDAIDSKPTHMGDYLEIGLFCFYGCNWQNVLSSVIIECQFDLYNFPSKFHTCSVYVYIVM